MDPTVTTYVIYLAISLALTIWVAQTLFTKGGPFLIHVFDGDEDLANSINHLLVVGFYLINLGFVSLALRLRTPIPDVRRSIEALSWKVGLVLLVLGAMHFGNLFVLQWMRRRSQADALERSRPSLPDGLAGESR